MKLTKIKSLTAILVAPLMLAGCAQDDLGVDGPRRSVRLSVTASRDALTRTTLSENGEGDLDCRWEADDYLIVTTTAGKKLGTIPLKPGTVDASVATFEGNIEYGDEAQLNFIYPGKNTAETTNGNGSIISVASQEGTLDALTSQDVLTATAAVEETDGRLTSDLGVMDRKLAFGRFHFNFPADVNPSGAAEITVGGAGVMTSANLSWAGEMPFTSATGEGIVSVSKADIASDLYLAVIPENGIEPTFTVTLASGATYTGKLPARNWTKGEYVRAETANGDDSFSYSGIVVDLEKGTFEDPNNPLTKWAPANLVRADALTNAIGTSSEDPGALYQWGRNHGYMSTRGIYNANVAMNEQYSQFVDAMGRFDNPSSETARILDYYVYNPNANRYFMVSGTATRYTPNAQYMLWYDSPQFYTSKQDLIDHPDKYFMDGTPRGKYLGYGTYGAGLDIQNYNSDYWLSSFGNGGSTWAERAKACGYEQGDPCPAGWRLPTSEEFIEIAPEGSGLDKNAPMANMLNGYSELRQTAAGVRYAIRWLYTGSEDYITIEAVVVDDSYTSKSQLTTLFWDQNANTKVVRKFPFTGMIQPLIANCWGGMIANTHLIVRPHHRGFLDVGYIPAYGEWNNYYWALIGPADINDGNRAFGGYWVSEKGQAFKFEAKERSNGKNTSNLDKFTQTSCLFFGEADPIVGYAIRPVRK